MEELFDVKLTYEDGKEKIFKMDKRIADLEAKLAEERNETLKYEKIYENEITELKQQLTESEDKTNRQWLQIQADTEYIQRLESQLAEKEKEIKYKDSVIKMLKNIKRYDIGEMIIENGRLRVKNHKDKIKFGVEQLEEVKKYIGEKIYELDTTYPKFERYEEKAYNNIIKFINLKIEELQKGQANE